MGVVGNMPSPGEVGLYADAGGLGWRLGRGCAVVVDCD